MKTLSRIGFYLLVLLLHVGFTLLLLKFGPGPTGDLLTTYLYYLVVFHALVSIGMPKKNEWINLVCGIAIGVIGFYGSLFLIEERIFPEWDSYGIVSTIVYCGFLPVLFWEVFYQVQKRYFAPNI